MPTEAERTATFRLKRHHLLESSAADAVTICRDVCGVQAQVISAAYLQLWARNHALSRSTMESALWKDRSLVKTSLMRQTLHLVPADEFPVYIAALRENRRKGALRIMAKFGIEVSEADDLTESIMGVLKEGPKGRAAINAAVRSNASKRVRSWMEKVWSIVRLPVAEGLVCYGSGEQKEVNFIRVDRWLPNLKAEAITAVEAQCVLFRKYLKAYGPATAADFAHWAGISMGEAKDVQRLLVQELTEISGSEKKRFLLSEDVNVFNTVRAARVSVHLLPNFDVFLLAHREKDHLLRKEHYKLVYRDQAWISRTVLVNGSIAGVWSYNLQKNRLWVTIEPFGRLSRTVRALLQEEAEALAKFWKASGMQVRIS